jgi:hypothetical protein
MNRLFPENSYMGKCSCGAEFNAPKGTLHCSNCLYKRIVELEALVEEMEDRIINELRLMSPALKKPKEGQGFFIMKEDGQWEPKL